MHIKNMGASRMRKGSHASLRDSPIQFERLGILII